MNKKEKILQSALNLFSSDGFKGTSTVRIAKDAGVSEGLIFKHFKNKQGLLNAIIEQLEEKINELIFPVMQEENPKIILKRAIIDLLKVDKKDYNFWKLQYKLKTDDNYDTRDKTQPYLDFLAKTFRDLNYENPQEEAELLFEIVDATFAQMVTGKKKNVKKFLEFLLEKYRLD